MSAEYKERLSAEEIRAYWTPERMAAAKPRDWTPATTPNPDAEPMPPPGEPIDIPGYDPTQSAKGSEIGLPSPVPSPTMYPWSTVGKLYFTANNRNFVGSASAIHNDFLLTAAHNIYLRPDGWSQNFIFIPGLTGAQQPFGNWSALGCAVMDEWQNVGHLNVGFDVGVINLGPGGNTNRPIGEVVGYLGQLYNQDLTQNPSWIEAAYPATTMYADPGAYTRSFNNGLAICKTGTLGAGASGGPWLCGDLRNRINGIASTAQSNTESGSPYFRTVVQNFLNRYI